ncbi:hypothetical protein B0H16DRAFT_1894515 [Mycena metata]|uniref:F-box domain-containing protein n=1 Tax=Mycena metata TaxID=1033252 RepID=A0AAD7MPQ0_9AGAR|nr:hypothetical protein B0H16DRAFT_1894515 [Mycena metata]
MSIEALQAHIEQLSAEITLQKDVVRQLERSKCAVQRQLNALRDPISQLPLEISSEIFLQCLRLPHGPRDPVAGRASQLLMNICSGWTSIALSNPALWDKIYLGFPGTQVLQLWAERARIRPLSIVLRGDQRASIADVMAFLPLAANLVECTIDISLQNCSSIQDLVLPSLEFLEERDGAVLQHLTLPSLNTLLATGSINNHSLLLFFQRSSPPLQI